jgi:diguanylate cyclase (GGDEF)-like protein
MLTTKARSSGAPTPADGVAADDVLVFSRAEGGFRLIGGSGRGEGWAEIVELRVDEEPLVERAWRLGLPLRTDAETPVRVAGPYWARHSAIVPVGHEHLVVFGSGEPIMASDAVIVRVAAQTVAQTGGASAEKLLGDELELVHAIRALMAYRAETVRDTARHIALVAARSLSCDVAVVQVASGDVDALEVIYLDGGAETGAEPAGPDAPAYLRTAAALADLRVEQTVAPDPRLWAENVVSRLTVPIGTALPLGAFALGHALGRPRGFTLLCQRIARALAESAELLLEQAIARESLRAERDVLERISRTDALTGLSNRSAWDEAVRAVDAPDQRAIRGYAVLSADLDGLKAVNDRYGHAIGDALIRGAANLLRTVTRDGDTVARIGGDEFLLLLPGTDSTGAKRIAARIRRNVRRWRVSEFGLAPELSVGWAVSSEDGAEDAVSRADQRMYAHKRRRAQGLRNSKRAAHSVRERRAGDPG